MLQIIRQTRAVRLLAQAMVLAFVLVTIGGSFAHACHDAHRGVAYDIVAYDSVDDGGDVALDKNDEPTSHRTSHKGAQPCCADLQCHGGIAIVDTGFAAVLPMPAAERFYICDQTHEDGHPACLDKPPRSAVQS